MSVRMPHPYIPQMQLQTKKWTIAFIYELLIAIAYNVPSEQKIVGRVPQGLSVCRSVIGCAHCINVLRLQQTILEQEGEKVTEWLRKRVTDGVKEWLTVWQTVTILQREGVKVTEIEWVGELRSYWRSDRAKGWLMEEIQEWVSERVSEWLKYKIEW